MRLSEILRKNIETGNDVRLLLPTSLASILIYLVIFLDVTIENQFTTENRLFLIGVVLGSSIYIFLQSLLIAPRVKKRRQFYIWLNSAISGIGLSLLAIALKQTHHTYYNLLLIMAVISIAILSERGPTYLLIALSGITYIFIHWGMMVSFQARAVHVLPPVVAIIITETILRLRKATQNHIHRLELVNKFSQQINSSLETEEVLSILNNALQQSIEADSYYVGMLKEDAIHLELLYDDGEYFKDVRVPKSGTLSGWVVDHQKPLFLPDLRDDVQLEGVTRIVIGKEKTSMSWMGVPMLTTHINGVLVVASYKVNAFTFSDMELLSNLAQHAALALDNTVHHKQVEEQSRLDSLTVAYNHNYFLRALQEKIDEARDSSQVLSLIMLDIDFFKNYNDSFGHQVGDMVLVELCKTIRENIKRGDFVGRWGGEEFAVALPGASGNDAHHVALRIQKTMRTMVLNTIKNQTIPTPTVSQGISVFPDEANNIDQFIYLADQRLYKAKKRGRNQIEPNSSHWKKAKVKNKMRGAE